MLLLWTFVFVRFIEKEKGSAFFRIWTRGPGIVTSLGHPLMINWVPSSHALCVPVFKDRLGGAGPGALVEAGWRGYRDMGGGENVVCRAPGRVPLGGGRRHDSVPPGRGRHSAPDTGCHARWCAGH